MRWMRFSGKPGQIFKKHSAEHPEPRVGSFMDAYGHLLTRHELELKPLTLKQIKKTLSRLKETGAAGLDGWSPSDLKALPDSPLRYRLLFYDIVEETNEWPRALTWASVTLIPKGEGGAPARSKTVICDAPCVPCSGGGEGTGLYGLAREMDWRWTTWLSSKSRNIHCNITHLIGNRIDFTS